MSEPRFIFNTIDYQNSANTVNKYVENYNAVNNAAVTGNTFKFQTNADRMKNLIGNKGQTRLSGYYPGLYCTLYRLTVTQNGSTIPSINGPGNTGWGEQLWGGPIVDAVNIDDAFLLKRTGLSDYVGAQLAGYIYSPVDTTITFRTVSDDGACVYLNGTKVLDAWIYQGPTTTTSSPVAISKGYTAIRVLYFEGGGGSILNFTFQFAGSPAQQVLGCGCFYNYANL